MSSWVSQVACILLPLCFVYDVFWVFIEPLIMGGTSVMVEASARFDAPVLMLNLPNRLGCAPALHPLSGSPDYPTMRRPPSLIGYPTHTSWPVDA